MQMLDRKISIHRLSVLFRAAFLDIQPAGVSCYVSRLKEIPMTTEKHEHLDVTQILARLPLFVEVAPEQVTHIATHTREKRLQKGEMLFHKGDAPRGFYVIVFGQIKLAFPSNQGNEKVINILGPRQSFGEAAMFMDRPYPVFAETLSDTLLLHIARNAVFDLLEQDTSFARRMLAGLSMRLHSLVQDH